MGAEAKLPKERVEALARKYGRLVELRSRRDGGGVPAARDELRALAAEFPTKTPPALARTHGR